MIDTIAFFAPSILAGIGAGLVIMKVVDILVRRVRK